MKKMENTQHIKPAKRKIGSEYNKSSSITPRVLISEFIKIKKNKNTFQNNLTQMLFAFGLCMSLLVFITAFEWKFYDKGNLVDIYQINTDFEGIIEVPVTDQPPPPPQKLIQPKIIEVPDEENILEDIEVDLDIQMDEDMRIDEIILDINNAIPNEEEADEIFTIVEQQPVPAGGYKAFYKYISDHMKYPPQARRMGIEGKVFIQFVVNKDGSLRDVVCVKGIGAGCDEEAVRVVQNLPNWEPGKQRGRPVKVQMILPLVFILE